MDLSNGQRMLVISVLMLLAGVFIGSAGTVAFGEDVGVVEPDTAMDGEAMEKQSESTDTTTDSGDSMDGDKMEK